MLTDYRYYFMGLSEKERCGEVMLQLWRVISPHAPTCGGHGGHGAQQGA